MRIVFRIKSPEICICLVMAYLAGSLFMQTASIANSETVLAKTPPIVKDFGQVDAGPHRLSATFPWENTSSEILEIAKVIRSCGCAEVTPTEGKIKPGEKVEFVAEIDITDWSGHAGVNFVVFFKDKMGSPVHFRAEFYRPKALEAEPKRLDFGYVDDPLRAFMTFKITWVSDSNDMRLKVLPNIFSAKGFASCRILKEEEKEIRMPNADKSTHQQEFLFQTFLRPQLPRGEFDDTVRIPAVLNGKIEYLEIAVTGKARGKVFSSPSRIVSFIASDKAKETEIEVVLLASEGLYHRPSHVNVSCSDPRLSIILTEPKAQEAGNHVGRISVTLSEGVPSSPIQAVVKVSYRIGEKEETFEIPVKIVIIG